MTTSILILPGLYNSTEGHWQTIWEERLPGAIRVQQDDWNQPRRSDWSARLDAAVSAAPGPVVLAAHSLGCALVAWWAGSGKAAAHADKLKGALLVAPPDVERENFPDFVHGFSPMPRQPLPFPAIVAASSDDPWCTVEKARSWASDWKARFHEIGPCGHVNAASRLGDWPQGQAWLRELVG